MDSSSIDKAKEFALFVHRDQSYGDGDYTDHLLDNWRIAQEVGMDDEDTEIISWLHDTIEDVPEFIRPMAVTFIGSTFSTHVSETVWAMSGIGSNRKSRNQDYYGKIADYPKAANHKLIDRLANMEHAKAKADRGDKGHWKMYMKEDEEFYQRVVKLASNTTAIERYERLTGRIA